jgi:hypothetical protein
VRRRADPHLFRALRCGAVTMVRGQLVGDHGGPCRPTFEWRVPRTQSVEQLRSPAGGQYHLNLAEPADSVGRLVRGQVRFGQAGQDAAGRAFLGRGTARLQQVVLEYVAPQLGVVMEL